MYKNVLEESCLYSSDIFKKSESDSYRTNLFTFNTLRTNTRFTINDDIIISKRDITRTRRSV